MPDSVPVHVRLSSIRVGTVPWPKLRYAVGPMSILIDYSNHVNIHSSQTLLSAQAVTPTEC